MAGRDARRSRGAVSTVFFVNGAIVASWVPHIPAVKAAHGIDDGTLGVVLLSMALGAVLALPMAGWLVGRFGSRRTTAAAAIGLSVTAPLPVLAPDVLALSLALLALGACNGMLDVSMNAQAVAVEERYGRPIMSSFHGLFSVGGLVGAAVAGAAIRLRVPPAEHVAAVAIASLVAVVAVRRALPASLAAARSGPVFARPMGVLLDLGMLAFAGLLAEGAMADWSAVYLRDALRTSPELAAAGFAAFSLAMAAGRFGGDRMAGRLGAAVLLRASGLAAAVGLGTALLLGEPLAAIAGCGLVGLGIANVIPILFSAAGRVPGVPAGTALAAVATTGYLGLLAGPPLIGVVAQMTSLPVALGTVSACCALIALRGGLAAGEAADVVRAPLAEVP